MCFLGVVDISNGGQPTDMKERKRQRARERYAQMDKQKKDELLRKRREAYQQKRARPLVSSEEAKVGASPSVLSQVQITTIGQGVLHHRVSAYFSQLYHLLVLYFS